MKPKVIFISSLPYSGSTLLDLLLGGHPRIVGLGEIFQLVQPNANFVERQCSCGLRMNQCPFWEPVSKYLQKNKNLSMEEKYEIVLNTFSEVFGEDYILVDSSKAVNALEILDNMPEINLKVIYLIKDVRSWTTSSLTNRKKSPERQKQWKGKYGWKRWIVQYIIEIPIYHFWQWYLKNKEMQSFIRQNNIKSFQVGYEELCLYTQNTISSICEFLDIEVVENMFSPKHSNSHIVRGNNMRSNKNKRQAVLYDTRWFCQREWLLPSLLFPNIMKFNKKEVYGNKQDAIWYRRQN